MKKEYLQPEVEITEFEKLSVFTQSGNYEEDDDGNVYLPFDPF